MSSQYIAVIVGALAFYLPKIGLTVGSEELTSIIQALVLSLSGIWVLIRRYQMGKTGIVPPVNIAGVKK
jgi:hypothetical protein